MSGLLFDRFFQLVHAVDNIARRVEMMVMRCDALRRIGPMGLLATMLLAGLTGLIGAEPHGGPTHQPRVSGTGTIRARAAASEIVIQTTDRLAGAIHSLTWNGKEFIDSFDHGRQLQSAASFDCGRQTEFWAECYNPTEAGSRADGRGERSSSRLLCYHAEGNGLRTTTQMAFWLAPGERSSGRLALNDTVLSRHLVSKRVRIGYKHLDHVIEYRVTFTVPTGEYHTYAQFEALTGYMPAEFERFWKFVPETGQLEPLDDGPGEQASPVVFSVDTGTHAMGVYSPDQPSAGYEQAGYGRFRFQREQVVKWNCVFRVQSPEGIAAGDYSYRVFVAVGALADVRKALCVLAAEFAAHGM